MNPAGRLCPIQWQPAAFSKRVQSTRTIFSLTLSDTMMLPTTVLVALATSLMTHLVSAHPEELFDKRAHLEEMTRHHVVAEVNSRGLQACSDLPQVKARREQAIARRVATFERLRQERNLANGKSSAYVLERSRLLTEASQPLSCTAALPPIFASGVK